MESGKKSCPKGQIKRKGYTTKKGTKVKPSCIRDRGKEGKGPKVLPELKKGTLNDYQAKQSDINRHRSLLKAVKKYGYSTVIHKMNAVSILLKNTAPKTSNQIKKDMKFLKEKLQK